MPLGKCPACQDILSYTALWCPHCGHRFDRFGSFGGYIIAVQEEQEAREAEEERKRRRDALHRFLFIAVVVLIVAIIVGAFLLFRFGGSGSPGTTSIVSGIHTIPSPTPVPSAFAAKMSIQQYYDDVNSQNYQGAYDLWYGQKESLATFQNGYSHTKHDTLSFGDVVLQADGTSKVFVSIAATEISSTGAIVYHTYKGYYIVGLRGNAWKILDGMLSLA